MPKKHLTLQERQRIYYLCMKPNYKQKNKNHVCIASYLTRKTKEFHYLFNIAHTNKNTCIGSLLVYSKKESRFPYIYMQHNNMTKNACTHCLLPNKEDKRIPPPRLMAVTYTGEIQAKACVCACVRIWVYMDVCMCMCARLNVTKCGRHLRVCV